MAAFLVELFMMSLVVRPASTDGTTTVLAETVPTSWMDPMLDNVSTTHAAEKISLPIAISVCSPSGCTRPSPSTGTSVAPDTTTVTLERPSGPEGNPDEKPPRRRTRPRKKDEKLKGSWKQYRRRKDPVSFAPSLTTPSFLADDHTEDTATDDDHDGSGTSHFLGAAVRLQTYTLAVMSFVAALCAFVSGFRGALCGGRPLLDVSSIIVVDLLVFTAATCTSIHLLVRVAPHWGRLLRAAVPASLFLALGLLWLALPRGSGRRGRWIRGLVRVMCVVLLWAVPLAVEIVATSGIDTDILRAVRLGCLAAALVMCLCALVAYPKVRQAVLRSQDILVRSALAKLQEDGAYMPRRLPLPFARPALRAVLAATLLGLTLTPLLAHTILQTGTELMDPWAWWCRRLAILLIELALCLIIAFAAAQPAVRHASCTLRLYAPLAQQQPALLTSADRPDDNEPDAFLVPQCAHSSLKLPLETVAARKRRQEAALRASLLFRDRCPGKTYPSGDMAAVAWKEDDEDNVEEQDSLRAQAGSTAPATLDGSPWSRGGRSSLDDLSWGRPASGGRRLGSSCSSESAAQSFDLTWALGSVVPVLRPQRGTTPRLRLDLEEPCGAPLMPSSQDVTPDSAVYVDLSPEFCCESRSLADLDVGSCPCASRGPRRTWRMKTFGGSSFSLDVRGGYEPLRRDEGCRCVRDVIGTTVLTDQCSQTLQQDLKSYEVRYSDKNVELENVRLKQALPI
ncbi:hypothetical protein ISCGN_023973 [Ixodes scapularis]